MNLKKDLLFDWSKPLRSHSKRIFIALFLLLGGAYGSGIYADIDSGELLIMDQANRRITGQVVDTTGDALIGVNVVVVGAETVGTITDIDGAFAVNLPDGRNQLKFSYIGYQDQVVAVGTRTAVNVTLQENTELLSEVVVVGYGTQKKTNLTGAIATVGAETFADKGVASNPLASMQGTLPGVTVTRSSSSPGRAGWDFEIRGKVSMNDAKPLVLVDGVPGSLDNLNPDDIDNISILKDASAAIYGARAGGGVVLVTTKRGTVQKTKVNYKGNLSVRTTGNIMRYMDMKEYMTTYEESYINGGTAFDANLNIYPRWVVNAYKLQKVVNDQDSPLYTGDFQGMNTWASYYNGDIHDYGFYDVDWNDVLWGTALSNSHSLSVTGGSEISSYNLSVGYARDNSILQWGDDHLDRYNIRLNNDLKVSNRIKLATNLSFDRVEKVYPQRAANSVGGQPAGSPVSTDEGLPYAWGGQYGYHWFSKLGGSVKDASNNFSASLNTTINLAKGLNLVGAATIRTNDYSKKWWESKIQWYYLDGSENQIDPKTDKIGTDNRTSLYQNYTAYLEYDKTIGQVHNFKIMGGSSYERNNYNRIEVTGFGTFTDVVHTVNTATSHEVKEAEETWALGSYFGRINYDYKSKYILEVLGRYDGSSRFLKGYRWKGFYGASAAYRISEEAFMQNIEFLDNLKLRASHGIAGNQAGINVYDGYSFVTVSYPVSLTSLQPIFGADGSTSQINTFTEKNLPAPSRTWEVITNSNIGLDFGFLGNRLMGSFDYYWRKNDDMLVAVTYPSQLGIEAPKTNNGNFKTHGWEFAINWRDRIGEVTYNIGFNVSDSKNKLISMKNTTTIENGFNEWLEGYAYGTYWGYKSMGLITTEEQLTEYAKLRGTGGVIPGTLRLGDIMFEDTDGNGELNADDMILLGEDTPHYTFGINVGLDWKGWDFSAFFQGVGKRTVMRDDYTRAPMLSWYGRQNSAWAGKTYSDIGAADYVIANNLQAYYNPVQTSADLMPKLSANDVTNKYNYLYSSAWWSKQNGRYVRLKNLTIGYTLPKQWISKAKIENLRLYFTGTDMWEISKIKDGWDPETSRQAFGGTNGSNAYPFTRSYSFGIDLTF